MLRVLLFFSLVFGSNVALGDDGDYENSFCRADVIFFGSSSNHRSSDQAFDACFKLVKAWGFDDSNGWKDRFCRVKRFEADGYNDKYSDNYRRHFWKSNFQHNQRFRSRYGSNIFYEFEQQFAQRLFNGRGLRIQISFSDHCNYKD